MTVASHLATILQTAYTASEITASISTAEFLLNGCTSQTITADQDAEWDTQIVELAIKVLKFGVKSEDEKVNPDTIDFRKLVTKEMKAAVQIEASDDTDYFIFKNKQPNSTWEG